MKDYSYDREEVYARLYIKQRGKCSICRIFKKSLEMDHIVPVKAGGSDSPVNRQLLCRSCNCSKRDSIPAGTQFTVFDAPRAISYTPTKRKYTPRNPNWKRNGDALRRRQDLQKEGKCGRCFKVEAEEGFRSCGDCRRKLREKAAKK